MSAKPRHHFDPDALASRERYQLLTSLVVPRPIGWTSTWSADRRPNLAPFSYFMALSASPMLVGLSIGHRRGEPKDTLANMRERGAFCVNVVSERFLEAMNRSAIDAPPDFDEFAFAGLELALSDTVDAPFVADCDAVLECEAAKEVDLGEAPNTLVIGRVRGVRLADSLSFQDKTHSVDPGLLRPVGRLGGSAYAMPGEIRVLPRPAWPPGN